MISLRVLFFMWFSQHIVFKNAFVNFYSQYLIFSKFKAVQKSNDLAKSFFFKHEADLFFSGKWHIFFDIIFSVYLLKFSFFFNVESQNVQSNNIFRVWQAFKCSPWKSNIRSILLNFTFCWQVQSMIHPSWKTKKTHFSSFCA